MPDKSLIGKQTPPGTAEAIPQEIIDFCKSIGDQRPEYVDPAELEFPFRQISNFVDLESGERLQIDPRLLRQTYRRELSAFLERCRKECSDRNIEYVLTPTSQPYDLMLLNYLARRKLLVRR